MHAARLVIELGGSLLRAASVEHLPALDEVVRFGKVRVLAPFHRELPVHAGIRERVVPDHAAQHADLRLAGLEEAEPGGSIEEEILDENRGSHGAAHARDLDHRPAERLDLGAGQLVRAARGQREPRDLRHARQGLPTEPERADPGDVVRGFDLAGGVPSQREERVLAGHPGAVVLDPDQALRMRGGVHGDEGASRVERVLDQLLRDRGGTIDDLPRSDLADDGGIEDADARHRYSRVRVGSSRGNRERNCAPVGPTTTSSSSDTMPCAGRWMLGSRV